MTAKKCGEADPLPPSTEEVLLFSIWPTTSDVTSPGPLETPYQGLYYPPYNTRVFTGYPKITGLTTHVFSQHTTHVFSQHMSFYRTNLQSYLDQH